jgi:TM2 domain-containing membrane protein YozV
MLKEADESSPRYAPLPELTGDLPMALPNHKVWLATLLGFLFIGAGQFYNRQLAKGLSFLGVNILANLICVVFHLPDISRLICSAIMTILGIVDARIIARKICAGRIVGKWEFF